MKNEKIKQEEKRLKRNRKMKQRIIQLQNMKRLRRRYLKSPTRKQHRIKKQNKMPSYQSISNKYKKKLNTSSSESEEEDTKKYNKRDLISLISNLERRLKNIEKRN